MSITVKAPAKLNLTLDVTGKREDGYHLLDMLVQTVSLADQVTVSLNGSGEVTLWESSGVLPTNEDNLAVRAAKLLLEKARSTKGCHIELEKNIPIIAGLGGGSADAAAVLKGLNQLLGSPFSILQLAEMSVELGADVPMCVVGGTIRATGIGEEIERLKPMPHCWFVITKNGQKPSTGEMYRRLREADITHRPDNDKATKAIEDGNLDEICRNIHNVFIYAITDETVTEDMEIIKGSNALAAGLSGSGPSVFGVFREKAEAEKCVERLLTLGKTAFLCETFE